MTRPSSRAGNRGRTRREPPARLHDSAAQPAVSSASLLPESEMLRVMPGMEKPRAKPNWLLLLGFFAIVVGVATFAGLFRPGEWYQLLDKPPWTPPNWAFPLVWSILYFFIAIAGWVIFTRAPWGLARLLWAAQLVLNGAWSFLFFGQQMIGAALVDIAVMWLVIVGLIVVLFSRLFAWSRLAGVLLVPYAFWVTLATALNASIWLRN